MDDTIFRSSLPTYFLIQEAFYIFPAVSLYTGAYRETKYRLKLKIQFYLAKWERIIKKTTQNRCFPLDIFFFTNFFFGVSFHFISCLTLVKSESNINLLKIHLLYAYTDTDFFFQMYQRP